MTRAFHEVVRSAFVDRLGARLVDSGATATTRHAACPIETQTLATIDLSTLPRQPDFDAAQTLHKRLAGEGLRVGQPVRCVPAGDGWGGTFRIALSMPQICDLAILGDAACADRLAADLNRIADRVARLTDQ
ncbi:hypothetical protein ABC347_09480 [Sphingomonas sp. 1P06PA]|uniref:hypothetical protein n=1 Tax=Sphingomonas sp. 1P06PA TaxID=554121 RepID=UPI0039A5EE0A